jgi:quercetin dioxygenase-like cupin family protein
MKSFVTATLGAAALVFSAFMASGASAQDKKTDKGAAKAVIKVVAENAKVTATETTYAPGAESNTSRAELRVVRALEGGTLQRTYADGKKEDIVYKTGDVRINEPGPAYTTKNVGKSTVRLYIVRLK